MEHKITRPVMPEPQRPVVQAQPEGKAVTPEQAARAFYAKLTKREDIRELLRRLSDR